MMLVEAPPRQRRLSFSQQVHRFLSVNHKDDGVKRDPSPMAPTRASTHMQSRPVSGSDIANAGKGRRLSLSRSPFSGRKENGDLRPESQNAKSQDTQQKQQNQQATPAENDPNWPLGPPTLNEKKLEKPEQPAEAARRSDTDDICVSPSWDSAEQRKKQRKEKKRMERDQKQLERDQKVFAKRLKQLEEAQERREGRSSSRRLIKRQPLANSSRASSVNAGTSRESSAGPIFHRRTGSSRASFSSSSHRPGSNHGNEPVVDSIEATLASENAKGDPSSMPPLSGTWAERFGPTMSKDLAFSYRRAFASSRSEEPSKRSLHATAKYADLRSTAQSSPVAGESSSSPNPSSLERRPLSSDSNKSARSQINGSDYRVSKAETTGKSKDIDCSSATALQTKDRTSKTDSPIIKTEHLSGSSKDSQSAANASVSMGGAVRRSNISQGANNDGAQSQRTNAQRVDRPPSAIFSGTSTRSSSTKEQPKAPAPQTSAANTSRQRKPGSSTLVVTNPDKPDPGSLEEPKTAPSQSNAEKQSTSNNSPADTAPTDESQRSRPGFARRLSLRLGLGDKKTVEARRRSDIVPSSSSKDAKTADPSIPVLSKEAVLASIQSSRSNPSGEPENNSARPASFLHPNSALTLGRSDRHGQSSGAMSDTTSQRSVHSTQYESISELEEDKQPDSPTRSVSSNDLAKQPSRRSSVDSVSDGYNTAHENFSTAESLGRASPAIAANHVPSVPTRNKSDDHVPRITTASNPSSSFSKEQSNITPSPTTAMITSNGTSSSNHNNRKATALQQSPKSLAKIFVICCHCKFWHDIPSKIYATLALPDHYHHHHNNSNNSRPSSQRTSSTSPLVPLNQRSNSIPNSNSRSVKCCWCNHNMNKSCCEGWTTIVYKHERLH
ncbi:hypothetical protein DTO217A2_6100 [Paecilomyces variotii]|nr:hypothetical protein DTO217A2_6100 [Paecilomyces variotii]KAJ9394436.1 hypothetical protein DTO282F9_8656 [Paecilomyces variotii]